MVDNGNHLMETYGLGPMTRRRRVKRGEDEDGGQELGIAGFALTCALCAAARGVLEAVPRLFATLVVGHGASERTEADGGKGSGGRKWGEC